MTPPSVPCGCCRGSGRVPLADEYARTLATLARLGEASGAAVGRAMGTTGESACNRLRGLERYGLATSRRSGRRRLYRVKEGAAT